MIPDNLIDYLQKEKATGVDFEIVRSALKSNGWDDEQINEAHLWYTQHEIEDVIESTTDRNLPDLQNPRAKYSLKDKKTEISGPQIPNQTPKELIATLKDKKTETSDKKNETNSKTISLSIVIVILFLISSSLLLIYWNGHQNNFNKNISEFISSIIDGEINKENK